MMKTSDRIYISGPMTSLRREEYTARFNRAEQLLREQGYTNTVNPTRVWACRWPWLFRIVGYKLTLFYDLWLLTRCHRIYKMPGWQQSRGASIESCVAFHFDVYTLPKPVREKIDKEIEGIIRKQENNKGK